MASFNNDWTNWALRNSSDILRCLCSTFGVEIRDVDLELHDRIRIVIEDFLYSMSATRDLSRTFLQVLCQAMDERALPGTSYDLILLCGKYFHT